jgi:tetratricopeptide (TPR) repeat protein/DNA-binding SARP family transcriptional activator
VEGVTSIQLLGRARANFGSETLEFLPNKRFQLLAYLAYQGEWVSRDKLVFLFWPDEANHLARQNLRQLLKHIRNFPWLTGLESDDHRVRWLVNTDVAAFKKALEKGHLERAMNLYGGALCTDLENGDSNEFASWLELERQTLHKLWTEAALQLAEGFETHENFSQAARVFETLHQAEPLAETTFRRYLQNLALSNQEDRAREVFESHEKILKQEFNSEPEKETLELIRAIRQGEAVTNVGTLSEAKKVATRPRVEPRHNLPAQSTLFVGRETERQKLSKALADPNCRLLSIVAPGGMGKTRLAIEVAKTQLEHFDEICFASFAAVTSPDLMVYTLADALELSLFGSKPPKEQVLEYLKNKNMLLVLDNLEHLLSGIDLIHDILLTASDIKILATSRERLSLQSEHLFDLYGLNVESSSSSDALQLFAERAKHNKLDFALEQNLEAVTKICELVGGMPLAIELAASWSRLLNPNEIVGELEQNLDILSTSARDLSHRHHSMRSVFEVSWQRLLDEEQMALRKLSVFQGGFEREAARAVADVDLSTLLSLLNKSFVWRNMTGRFSQHPLILQYIQQKANDYPEERSDTQDKHANYYAGFMMHRWGEEFGPHHKEIIDALEVELDNVRAAWPHLLSNTRIEQIDQVRKGLWRYYRYRGSRQAAIDMLVQAVPVLEGKPDNAQMVLTGVLNDLAQYHMRLGKFRQAKALAEQSLALSRTHDFPTVRPLITLGVITHDLGDYVEARHYYEEALAIERTENDRIGEAMVLFDLAQTSLSLGDYTRAEELQLEALTINRELKNLEGISTDLDGLGEVYLAMNELEKAEEAFRESLEIARKIDFRHSLPWVLQSLGEIAFERRDYQKAQAHFEEALSILAENPEVNLSGGLLINLARVATHTGNFAASESYLKQALSLAQPEAIPQLLHGLIAFAELSISKAQVKQGVTLISFLSRCSAIDRQDRDEALKLLETARQQLSVRAFTEAQEESKSLTLEEIVTGILERETDPSSKSALR